MLEISLCNELLADEGMSIDRQAGLAADLGYCGLELAPHTMANIPHELSFAEVESLRRSIESHGIRVTGLHWLLSGYPDASITDPDAQAQTAEITLRLIDICADLGGEILVHGSPAQRKGPGGPETIQKLADYFAPIAEASGKHDLIYCIEPLSRKETEVINTTQDGLDLVNAVNHPAFATMIDTSAAGQTEPPVDDLIRRFAGKREIAHLHFNDTNRGAPGTGDDPFDDIMKAVADVGWSRPVSIEPFWTRVNAHVTASIGIATLRACEMGATQ